VTAISTKSLLQQEVGAITDAKRQSTRPRPAFDQSWLDNAASGGILQPEPREATLTDRYDRIFFFVNKKEAKKLF
jgi:hypothetical protein